MSTGPAEEYFFARRAFRERGCRRRGDYRAGRAVEVVSAAGARNLAELRAVILAYKESPVRGLRPRLLISRPAKAHRFPRGKQEIWKYRMAKRPRARFRALRYSCAAVNLINVMLPPPNGRICRACADSAAPYGLALYAPSFFEIASSFRARRAAHKKTAGPGSPAVFVFFIRLLPRASARLSVHVVLFFLVLVLYHGDRRLFYPVVRYLRDVHRKPVRLYRECRAVVRY